MDTESNLQIEYLDERMLQEVDPFSVAQQWFSVHFPSDSSYEPVSPLFTAQPTQVIQEYIATFLTDALVSTRHSPVIRYELELISKTGRQGGKIPWSKAKSIFEEYYVVLHEITFSEIARVGLRTLKSMIQAAIRANGYPSIVWELSTQNTAFAMPCGGKKSNVLNHLIRDFYLALPHPYALLPNVRRMRSKDRGIFAASALDCDAIQPVLTAVRTWLKNNFPHIFGAWFKPELYTYPDIFEAMQSRQTFLETDFLGMDKHFSLEVVRELVLPIYELLLPQNEYLRFAGYVEECFSAPLLCGDQLWTGLHNLFSGLPITSDFETLYDVIIYLGAHVLAGQSVRNFGKCFKAIGDDVVYSGPADVVQKVYDMVRQEFTANGVVLSEEKTRINVGECRFCRQVYYPAGPIYYNELGAQYRRPVYPFILALNNALQPESLTESRSSELLSDFCRFDNSAADPWFRTKLEWTFSRMDPSKLRPLNPDYRDYFEAIQIKDWWYKVYGDTYSIGDSPSAKYYATYIKSELFYDK